RRNVQGAREPDGVQPREELLVGKRSGRGLEQGDAEVSEGVARSNARNAVPEIEPGNVPGRCAGQFAGGVQALRVPRVIGVAQQEGAAGGAAAFLDFLRKGRGKQDWHKQKGNEFFHRAIIWVGSGSLPVPPSRGGTSSEGKASRAWRTVGCVTASSPRHPRPSAQAHRAKKRGTTMCRRGSTPPPLSPR